MRTEVKDYYLKMDGLYLTFTHQGKYNAIRLDPTETLTLLEDRSYIYHFLLENNKITVFTQTLWASPGYDGEPIEEPVLIDDTWEEFVNRFSFELNDRIALELVNRLIQLQELKYWEENIERVLEIPTLIRNISNAS